LILDCSSLRDAPNCNDYSNSGDFDACHTSMIP
jgi:hypothetical protein